MAYTQQTWIDGPAGATPLSAARLNYMEAGIAAGGGDLPEFSPSAQTSTITSASMLGKTTRYDTTSGTINQTLPAAVVGAVFAVGWDAGTAALTLTAAGTDVIGSGAATSAVIPLLGEVVTHHCTSAGRWRSVSGLKTQTSLDARFRQFAKRVGTTTSSSTPTANADTQDMFTVTAAAAGMTVGAPTGTPGTGQMILYRFLDNGTVRTIAWNAAFRAVGITLPTTTVINKTLYVLTIWNEASSTWDAISVGQQ